VEAVTISLSSHDGELLFRRRDEIPPYGLPILRVPPGRFTLDAEARDFAGNTSNAALPLQIGDEPADVEFTLAGGACAWSARRSTGASGVGLLLVFAIGLRRVRRATRCRATSFCLALDAERLSSKRFPRADHW
jgi:hypothetical protein